MMQGDRGVEKKSDSTALTANIDSNPKGVKTKGTSREAAWMTADQLERFAELREEWTEIRSLDAGDLAILRMMACVETELAKLQRFINTHSPTYTVRGKSGDNYSRARPEYQQLQEARTRLCVLIDKITQRGSDLDHADDFIAL
jgi:hypothetical protein